MPGGHHFLVHYRVGDPLEGGPPLGDKNAIAFLSAGRGEEGAGRGAGFG